MARKLRVQYSGAIYQVMNRGDRREPIFKDNADRQRFLDTLGEAGVKTAWQIHAYCLMPNHFDLVVETPQANLVAGAALKEQLLEQVEQGVGEHHGGEEKWETDVQKAKRIVEEELRKRRWTDADLSQRRKTDATKVQIAARLRRETVQTWIAQRLQVGCRHTLANCLKSVRGYNSRD